MSPPNEQQFEAWNGDSGTRWVADADRRDQVLAPVADALFRAVRIAEGESVLDLGCGCGATTIAAADAAAGGHVVGVDLSAPMLDVARQRAGARPVTFAQADAQTHAFEAAQFDVVTSRFGTMFFDDPIAAFANVRAGVRVGGRLCLATWQELLQNDWLMIPGAALLQFGSLPESGSDVPGMFAQADPTRVEEVLTAAGWSDIRVEPERVTLWLGADEHEAVDYLTDTGVARAVLDTIDPGDRAKAIAAVETTLAAHRTENGVELGAAINLIGAIA